MNHELGADLTTGLDDRWERTMQHWLHELEATQVAEPGFTALLSLPDGDVVRLAQIWHRDPVEIEVFQSFIRTIDREIRAARDAISHSLWYDARPEVDADLEELGLRCVAEHAASFVLLHELSHALCGHLDIAEMHGALGMAEGFIDFVQPTAITATEAPARVTGSAGALRSTPLTADESYFLEIEADSTALEFQIKFSSPPDSRSLGTRLAGEDDPEAVLADTLDGIARSVGFRAILVAQWVVLRIIEAERIAQFRRNPSSAGGHPLPGARLIAAWSTILQHFAEIQGSDAGTMKLEQDEGERLVAGLQEMLRPLLTATWPPMPSVPELDVVLENPARTIAEFGDYILNRPARSPASQQLQSMLTRVADLRALLRTRRRMTHEDLR